ncbi:ATP-binding protein [Streptomyces sp. NPDC059994]|uniref:ATP-binding protein n=1 Tax=Streptomyces sp. NPDC059994 TaxID=3347029 RepID=UPI0036AB4E07
MDCRTSPRPKDVEWPLPRTPRSVGHARALLAEQARAWKVPDELTETAVLLLSELMTNAVRHAHVPLGQAVVARCVLGGDIFRVEVIDANVALPCPRPAGPDDGSGRGLALVEALSDAWGANPRPYGTGKTVWFELITGGRL